MKTLAEKLAHTPVFEKLPERERLALAGQAIFRKLARGEYLCHQGEIWPYAVFVDHGELRWAMLSVGGREQVLFRIPHGHPFLAHSLFDGLPMPASLNAVNTAQVHLWPEDVIHPVMSRCPEMLWAILKAQTDRMRQARELIYGLALKPVAGRLARLLLEQAAGQEGRPIQREMTLSEIASTISTSQEVVCRLLYQFQSDRLIELNRASFTLTDRTALQDMLEQD